MPHRRIQEKHVYNLKIFKDESLICRPPNNHITFVDHSNLNDFLLSSTGKRHPPIDLLDPRYPAVHAAIAEILNVSGAD
jgi:hypothetical protein